MNYYFDSLDIIQVSYKYKKNELIKAPYFNKFTKKIIEKNLWALHKGVKVAIGPLTPHNSI